MDDPSLTAKQNRHRHIVEFHKVAFRIYDFSERVQGQRIARAEYVGPRRRIVVIAVVSRTTGTIGESKFEMLCNLKS